MLVQVLLLALSFFGASQARAQPSDEAVRLYEQGVEQYNEGNLEDAVEALARAAALDSDVPDFRYHLGLAYLRSGDAKKAARELESTLSMMGMRRATRVKEPMVLVQVAIAYLELGRIETAKKRVQAALKRDEAIADAHYVQGLIAEKEGDHEAARAGYRAALALDRDHPQANIAMAVWLEANEQPDEARENLRHASHGTDENFGILMGLGSMAYRQGDYEEAALAFESALMVDPGHDEASYNLGTVRLAQGNYREAIALYRPLVERDVPHDRAAFNLAVILHERQANAEAQHILEALLARTSDLAGARFTLALVYEAQGELAKAETAYRETLVRQPAYLPAFLNLAALLAEARRNEEALDLLEQSLSLPMEPSQEETIRKSIETLRAASSH